MSEVKYNIYYSDTYINLDRLTSLIQGIYQQYFAIINESHEDYKAVVYYLSQTKNRLISLAETYHVLAIKHSDDVLYFTDAYIESDYQFGREDVKEKNYAKLRQRKREVKDSIDRLYARGVNCVDELATFNDLKIPNKKREKKYVAVGPIGFKMSDYEARADIAAIRARAEKADVPKIE